MSEHAEVTQAEVDLIEQDFMAGAIERTRRFCQDDGYKQAYIRFSTTVAPAGERRREALSFALQVLPDDHVLLAALAKEQA